MSPENTRANAAAELARADESLRAATLLLREGFYNDAVSDAYYAAFHAVRALLFTLGEEPRSHRGALHLFNVRFVQAGKLDASHLSALARAQYDRVNADYGALVRFTAEDATEEISGARALIDAARDLLRSEGWLT